jgi:AcrR family transcriptional regulator
MGKGEETKAAILSEAMAMASVQGLSGLTIAGLADRSGLSKSGLFAHFGSKEALQRSTLEATIDGYVRDVIEPAVKAPRGEPRIRAIFENWLAWNQSDGLPGGCPLMTASIELDDQPGALRDFLARQQERWLGFIARAAEIAVQEGHFRADFDCRQFAFEFNCIGLGFNHAVRLLRTPEAEQQTRRAFDGLLDRAHP